MSTTREFNKSLMYLYRMFHNFLTSDNDLVSLTGYDTDNMSILAGTPDAVAKYPCVVFWDVTTNLAVSYIDEVHTTLLDIAVMVHRENFKTVGGMTFKGKLLCDAIAGRIQYLLQPGESRIPNFNDDYVLVYDIAVRSRLNIKIEEDEDIWRTDLLVDLTWCYKV
ncbi:MAG: hypothetical protein DRN81_02590 [Thermoproteota archaeon]|nr:MAG: hypothetical protein DRN81_02590 [Candidatus Korarchaeota archaeon]